MLWKTERNDNHMIQTNRTLLVEELEPNMENIVSSVRYIENRESFSDEEIAEIHSRLEVSSFEEVVEKFSPRIYMSLDTDGLKAVFYRKLPENAQSAYQAVPICESMTFFDELVSLMENKRKRRYVLTSFQNFGDKLLPSKEPDEFWRLWEKILRTVCTDRIQSATELMDELNLLDNRYKETFRLYMETVNEKNHVDSAIWYAIIPRLPYVGGMKENIRERFLSTAKDGHVYPANQIEGVQVVLDILGRYQVQTFLSVIAQNDTAFHAVRERGIDSFEESFQFLNSSDNREYIIPCYPNFTIIPQEYTLMMPGRKTSYDVLENRIYLGGERKMWMDELIVEASYIGAGLVAACQCPSYLAEHYGSRKVQEGMPGVAYRLCGEGHNAKTKTKMFGEVVNYSDEIYNQIGRYGKGIIFAPYRGYVVALTDRAHSYKSSTPDNIAIIQTLTYMERVIRYETQDYKEHLIKDFFQERPGSIIVRWKQAAECVNGMLKKEEGIRYYIDSEGATCRFELKFNERKMDDTVRISK